MYIYLLNNSHKDTKAQRNKIKKIPFVSLCLSGKNKQRGMYEKNIDYRG